MLNCGPRTKTVQTLTCLFLGQDERKTLTNDCSWQAWIGVHTGLDYVGGIALWIAVSLQQYFISRLIALFLGRWH